jgi:ABC-2 type transport system ATP-binding protein
MIEVRDLAKSYPTGFWRRRVEVLREVSFSVRRNEVVGFLGPNGAGKTTTIKIINRLAFPDGGTVMLFGATDGFRPEVRRRIGFMPEQPYFYEYLTGEEFLHLCGRLYGMGRPETRERSGALLSRVGLEGARRTAIRKYSKGMMQRLGLAQALLHDPELVVLDEPMSGLDPLGRMEVRNLIRELRAAGKTVFFSSHIISDVEALCDRVILLHRGRKVAEGSLDELLGGGDMQHVEITFSPVPDAAWLGGSGLPPGQWTVEGHVVIVRARDEEEADRWIGCFRRAGSRVRSCVPVKRSLEDIYVQHVGGGNPPGGARG